MHDKRPVLSSRLEELIPPEINNNSFYADLKAFARRPDLMTFLEIGSSSGEGSTHALVSGIRQRPDNRDVRLFCMEVSRQRAKALTRHYRDDGFVHCYNLSSVPAASFPDDEELIHYFCKVRYPFNRRKAAAKLGVARRDLRRDIEYIAESGKDGHGIRTIKSENGIRHFDFALIDGSEYTGERELWEVIGARIIALDDIRTFKCWNAHRIMKAHPGYKLFRMSRRVGNGYSIFVRNH